MERALVIGASGFLGGEVCRAFARTHHVTSVSRRGGQGLEAVDVRDRAAVAAAVERNRPDVVLLLAACREPDLCEDDPAEARRLNTEPARTLREVLPGAARLIFVSTDYVFDGERPPYTEASTPNPVSVYGRTKVEAEQALAGRPHTVILRVPLLIGGGATLADSGFIGQMVAAARGDREQVLDDVLVRFPTWTRDVAEAMLFLLTNDASGLFHFSGPRGGTRYAWTVEMARLLGVPHDHLKPSHDVVQRKAPRPRNSQLAAGKIRELGFTRATDFGDVVRTVLAELS